MFKKKKLQVGDLVRYYPVNTESIRQKEAPVDFRVGVIIDEKPGHWLIYKGDDLIPAWYIEDELQLLI